MQIKLDNIWGTVTEADLVEINAVRDILTQEFKPYRDEDQPPPPLLSENNIFPVGIWPYLKRRLEKIGAHIEVTGEHIFEVGDVPHVPDDLLSDCTLRPHQIKAISKGIARKFGVMWVSVSGGKTEIQAGMHQMLDRPSLLVTDSVGALQQTQERWLASGLKAPHLWGEDGTDPEQKTVLASTQTVYSGLKRQDPAIYQLLASRELLQMDEAHHLGSAFSWQAIAMNCPAEYRFFYSGTPYLSRDPLKPKGKDLSFTAYAGPLVIHVPAWYLKKMGYTVDLDIYMVPVSEPDLSGLPPHLLKNYRFVYKRAVLKNKVRNNLIVHFARVFHMQGERPMILVKGIDHGIELGKRLSQHLNVAFSSGGGVFRTFNYGEVTESELSYAEAKRKFISGELDVLLGSKVYYENQNIPEITAMILASAGRSMVEAVQRTGRGVRTSEGKQICKIVDFHDTTHFYMSAQSNARAAEYREEGYEPRYGFPPGTNILLTD